MIADNLPAETDVLIVGCGFNGREVLLWQKEAECRAVDLSSPSAKTTKKLFYHQEPIYWDGVLIASITSSR